MALSGNIPRQAIAGARLLLPAYCSDPAGAIAQGLIVCPLVPVALGSWEPPRKLCSVPRFGLVCSVCARSLMPLQFRLAAVQLAMPAQIVGEPHGMRVGCLVQESMVACPNLQGANGLPKAGPASGRAHIPLNQASPKLNQHQNAALSKDQLPAHCLVQRTPSRSPACDRMQGHYSIKRPRCL